MCGGGGGGSTPANTQKMVRYAPYIEARHSAVLNTVADIRKSIINNSPYTSYIAQDVDAAMLGVGYTIADFPSLYDMFGKFMAGYSLEVLWDTTFSDQIQSPEVNAVVRAEMAATNTGLISKTIPEFKLAMRENNTVASSSFVVNKANIECRRTKNLANVSAEVKFKLLPNLNTKYNAMLNWQKETIDKYAELMKLYYMTTINAIDVKSSFNYLDVIWPFSVLEFERAVLATMRRAADYNKLMGKRKRSDLSKVLLVASYTVQGASIGSMFSGPGVVIGAVVGFIVGVATVLWE